MQIKSVIIENFRGYRKRQEIKFNNLTAFVGRNDVGKSTVLEALDIFFNEGNGQVSFDANDINIDAVKDANDDKEANVHVVIGVEFSDVPESVVLDENNETSLSDEYLLNSEGALTVIKRYSKTGKPKVFIEAFHPSCPECSDLLIKKQSELRKMAEHLGCDHNKNAEMRAAIRHQYKDELNLKSKEIDVSKEDAKNIWEKLKAYLPIYCLFQSDRSNGDKDKEVQDPLKEAVKIIFAKQDIKAKCQEIYLEVMRELEDVSDCTLRKVREMNPELASSLHPSIPPSDCLKWIDVFKTVSITGDSDIPINKRGSGVRRMILLNFFRAEAERNKKNKNAQGIIYAIEEPETAQHIEHQRMLIESLKQLADENATQVVITTHSSNILKCLSFDDIRLVKNTTDAKVIEPVVPSQLPYPSLNEIAYTHFGDISVEYHDELYGHIEFQNRIGEYKQGKKIFEYKKMSRDGALKTINLTKTEIILKSATYRV